MILGAVGCTFLGVPDLQVLRRQRSHRVSHGWLTQLRLSELVLVLAALLGLPVGEHVERGHVGVAVQSGLGIEEALELGARGWRLRRRRLGIVLTVELRQ